MQEYQSIDPEMHGMAQLADSPRATMVSKLHGRYGASLMPLMATWICSLVLGSFQQQHKLSLVYSFFLVFCYLKCQLDQTGSSYSSASVQADESEDHQLT
jgi:hypothetical protein